MDSFRGIDSRASSETSKLTRDKSGESSEQENISSMDSPAREYTYTEWTDEKHSLYLKSIEASFVNQLYNSMNFLGWRSQNQNLSNIKSSRQIRCNDRTPSGQFKVLRDGSWQKIGFERPGFQLNKEEPGGILVSPCIQPFRPVSNPRVLASQSLQESSASKNQAISSNGKKEMSCSSVSANSSKHYNMRHYYSCDQDLIAFSTEVSDQNFVDDKSKSKRTSGMCSSKKMKILTADSPSNDQVVLHNKLAVTGNVFERCVPASR